jgi:hypothetical protein
VSLLRSISNWEKHKMGLALLKRQTTTVKWERQKGAGNLDFQPLSLSYTPDFSCLGALAFASTMACAVSSSPFPPQLDSMLVYPVLQVPDLSLTALIAGP